MPLLALLLACAALVAGCGDEGPERPIDLDAYAAALSALRESEGEGQLHAARVDGDEITFDLVREGPATRVRWTGDELETTGDDVVAGEQGRDLVVGGDGRDLVTPSPLLGFGGFADGEPDTIECGEIGRNDGDPGDQTFVVLSDGDVANDCATVVEQ